MSEPGYINLRTLPLTGYEWSLLFQLSLPVPVCTCSVSQALTTDNGASLRRRGRAAQCAPALPPRDTVLRVPFTERSGPVAAWGPGAGRLRGEKQPGRRGHRGQRGRPAHPVRGGSSARRSPGATARAGGGAGACRRAGPGGGRGRCGPGGASRRCRRSRRGAVAAMPMKGRFPVRRTLQYLSQGDVIFKSSVKVLTVNYNTAGERSEGAR